MAVVEIVTKSTEDLVVSVMGEEARPLAIALTEINEKLPVVVGSGEGHGLRMQEPDRRLSWGIGGGKNRRVVKLLVEREDGRALAEAEGLVTLFPNLAETAVVGRAHSTRPTADRCDPMSKGLLPGASIGNFRGYPGSIGAVVRPRGGRGDWIGVTSASHVLGRANLANRGDEILAPGHPDGPRSKIAICGRLHDYTLLTHFSRSVLGDNYLCCSDLAVVRLDEECEHEKPKRTLVVDPKNPDKRVPLKGTLSVADSIDHIGAFVTKVGRTSDVTHGTLDLVGLQRQAIQLPDGRIYLYSDVLAIQGTDGDFSQPGDSGALVYTDSMLALGFVIGGVGNITFVSPIETCLADHNVEIVL